MSTNIYVGNLSYNANDDNLRTAFEEFGEVVSVKVITDRETGKPKGFAFVEMAQAADADNAIKSLDGTEFLGRNLKVNLAKPKTNSRDGGGRDSRDSRGSNTRNRW